MTDTSEKYVSTKRPLSPATVSKLQQVLPAAMTKSRRGARGMELTYISASIAITIANEIFGHGGWSKSVKEIIPDKNADGQTIGYSALVSLTIHENGAVYEDVGYEGMNERTVKRRGAPERKELAQSADEHERARKSAVSDGLKRCLRHAGGMFGNELYANDEDRKKIANAAIDAWIDAGLNEDEAYDQVVSPPYRKTWEVPAAKSIASIQQAVVAKPGRNG